MPRRDRQAGAVFKRVLPPIPAGVGRPGATTPRGQRDVEVSSLSASQRHLDPARVKHYVDNPSDEPITVLQVQQFGNVIYDGHHRAAAAKQRGETTVRADVRSW